MIRRLIGRLVARGIRIAGRLLYLAVVPFMPNDPSLKMVTSREVEDDSYYRLSVESFSESIQEFGLEGLEPVLDVGSGNGRWLAAFSSLGTRAVGVEPRSEAITQTKAHKRRLGLTGVTVLQGAAERLPIASESIELYFSYGVLMYCNSDAYLREADRVLKSGGSYFIAVQGPGYPLIRMVHGLKARDYAQFDMMFQRALIDLQHLARPSMYDRKGTRSISRKHLKRAIAKLGWRVEYYDKDIGFFGARSAFSLPIFYALRGTKC